VNRLQREIISRIAMIILAGILLAGGIIIIAMEFYAGFISGYAILLAIGLIAAGGFLVFSAFISKDTLREPQDARYRIK
jgi:hypothetical protein